MKLLLSFCLILLCTCSNAFTEPYLSPSDLDFSPDGQSLFVTAATGKEVLQLDTARREVVRRFAFSVELTAAELSTDGKTLYVTGGGPKGVVFVMDVSTGTITKEIPVGHSPTAPNLSPDGQMLYVCNQFNNDVSFVDLASGEIVARVAAVREPIAADLTPDGKYLFVANLLPDGPANVDYVACKVSVINTETREVTNIPLVNGAEGMRDIRVSPDGETVFATSIMARFMVPTTQLERGWVATDALSVIRVSDFSLQHTVLLDDAARGFPNPWAIGFSEDANTLVVSAAGTHEISLIDLPAMLAKLDGLNAGRSEILHSYDDLAFLSGIRERIQLAGNGPRSIEVQGDTIYVGHYYSDSIDCVSFNHTKSTSITSIELNPGMELSQIRKGEIFFNDATQCFQNWLSCATCHPDARTDGMNWDLLNDGIGNPKNVKSMLLAHATPPTTWLGVRPNAEVSVRSGFTHIQFSARPEEDSLAVDAYLKSLNAVPSPFLEDGQLSASGERGRQLFDQLRCYGCHSSPLFTDQEQHKVGTTTGPDTGRPVDTPSLVELWRTGPYLHDGRSATVHDVLTKQGHGKILQKTEGLTEEELQDLITYLLSIPVDTVADNP